MSPDQEIESLDNAANDAADDSISVDEFIRELEAKEKDLHITAETTVIEIAEAFDDGELPDFMKDEFPAKAAKPKETAPPASPKAQPANSRLEAENKQLKDKLAKLENDQTELVKLSQRRSKDFANYKDRMDRERRETFRNQVANLATQMLPVLDNLNRALDFAAELHQTEETEFHQFFDGVVLVNQQVNEVLAGMGITPIVTVGELFDPHFHEAAATEESDEFEPNTICAEVLKGYRIGDRVIRHSVVRVAKAPADPSEPSIPEKIIFQESDDSEPPASEDPSGSANDEAKESTQEAPE